MPKLSIILTFFFFVCKEADEEQHAISNLNALPLRPTNGVTHEEWLKKWQENLASSIILECGEHQGEVQGSYYSRVKVIYPVFLATISIKNNSGYRLKSGQNLYFLQSCASSEGKCTALEVIGGQFREKPEVDYAGVIEIRGSKLTPDITFDLIDVVDTISRRGFFGGSIDIFFSIASGFGGNILPRQVYNQRNFGEIENGGTLSFITNDLQMTVRVDPKSEGPLYVVSPTLTFTDKSGSQASFRYLYRFDNDGKHPSETNLLALDEESLIPIIDDKKEPQWKRVFATGWVGGFNTPSATMALVKTVGNEANLPIPIRKAALSGLIAKPSEWSLLKNLAANNKEPLQLRKAAIWALGNTRDTILTSFLKGLLLNSDRSLNGEVIDALTMIQAKNVTDELVSLFSKRESQNIRSNISSALLQLGDQTSAIGLEVLGTKDKTLRRTIIPLIAKLGGIKSSKVLEKWFIENKPVGIKDDYWPVRMDICEQLCGLNDSISQRILKMSLSDSNSYVRRAAIQSLAIPGSRFRINQLLTLSTNQDQETAIAAIRELGKSGLPEAKARIVEIVKNTALTRDIRWPAIEGLAYFKDDNSIQILNDCLGKEKDNNLRAVIYESLAAQKLNKVISTIELGLYDSSSFVVKQVAWTLRSLQGSKSCSAMLKALLKSKEGDRSKELVRILKLPGCRNQTSFISIVDRLGLGDREYEIQLKSLLKSWTGQDGGDDKVIWKTLWND